MSNDFLEILSLVGHSARDFILGVAGLLRAEESPGVVAIALGAVLFVAVFMFLSTIGSRRRAIGWLAGIVTRTRDEADFSSRITELDQAVQGGSRGGARQKVITAWDEYRETLVVHAEGDQDILRNAVRPGVFFNLEDLHFGAGFWRIVPGLFVTFGLFLTFLGLISALDTMGQEMADTGEMTQGAMTDLLTVASAKFIMSLTGLLCSIVFTIVLRYGMGRVEGAVNGLNREIEKRLSFISLEDLAVEQLAAMREQREHFRKIGMELVAELGRPLREELPQAISNSISTAMSPLIEKVGEMSTDGVGQMVGDLSSRFSDDVGQALAGASERLGQAGDRIGALVDRMDQSSGKMGTEMETAIVRLGQAVEELRTGMTAGAEATAGAFTQGVEGLLAAMNASLEGIRENTGEGAKAMSAAAEDMRTAAAGIRSEMENAAQQGADAARARMQASSAEASEAIGTAGANVIEAFGKTSTEIARITDEMASKAGQDLFEPMSGIAERLDAMVDALTDGATMIRRASDGVRAGADASNEAAGSFRESSQALVAASDPVRASVDHLERSTNALAESARDIAGSARSSAQSAAQALAAAQEVLGGQQRAIETTLDHLRDAIERMRGQGEDLEDIDEKLGHAFDRFTQEISTAVDSLFNHVSELQTQLNPALDTMREIVEQAEQFAAQSRRS